ncbi:MAG: hydrogenase assembly chaperone HypC/HupF [Actinomycetia bacterium]|nr:hydrogenase assembly chaperone HypC/HupF [Actinomycetes bacterium]
MCLGIPGEIVEMDRERSDLALVEVSGVRRMINVALLEDEPLAVGDWILIHVGFAMSRIDEAEARRALDMLRMMGSGLDEELAVFMESSIE